MKLTEFYFTLNGLGCAVWTCLCGEKRARDGTEFRNLASHITAENFAQDQLLFPNENATQYNIVSNYVAYKKVLTAMAWNSLIVKDLLSFSFVESSFAWTCMKTEYPTRRTLMTYMQSLTNEAKKRNQIFNLISLRYFLTNGHWF